MKKYLMISIGSMILAFGLYNVHYQSNITEGGVLGLILLLKHLFDISPSVSGFILDVSAFLIGFKFLGINFLKCSFVATISFSIFYGITEQFPPIIPSFIDNPLIAAIIAGIFVGISVGIVVREGAALGGDDALALTFNKLTGKSIATFYFASDAIVLLMSLAYLPIKQLAFSFISVIVSSSIISKFHNK